MRSAAVRMSWCEARTSYLPATKLVGTSIERSETRWCSEECSARCMYQSVGVVRNSRIARRASSGSGIGSMKPEWVITSMVIGPIGQVRADDVQRLAGQPHQPGER